jgi:glycosyltransferase involved in cell wall biosynthesis
MTAPRVAFLWNHLSGYFAASLEALLDTGAEVLLVYRTADAAAPYADFPVAEKVEHLSWSDTISADTIRAALDAFDPHGLVVNSWNAGVYRKVAREMRGKTARILTMDNQWLGTPKQWAGIAAARFVVRPMAEAVFVAGERQAVFTGKLGFPAERLLWGLYTCDHPRFSAVAERRAGPLDRRFLFVGRLVKEKGVDTLAAAYRDYRSAVGDPWPLVVAGTGPLGELLAEVEGVEMLGFTQPADLPAVFERAGCLVLPSRFEPWATVIHEAAAAGLAVICTDACGASTRFLLDGYNGVLTPADKPSALTDAFRRLHRTSAEELSAMSEASRSLARQLTPQRWAATLLRGIADLRDDLGMAPVGADTGVGDAAGLALP